MSVQGYERAIFYLSATVDITNAKLPPTEWIQAMSQETSYFLFAGFSSCVHEKADYVITGALVSGGLNWRLL